MHKKRKRPYEDYYLMRDHDILSGESPPHLPASRDELSVLATDLHAEDELVGVVHV